VLHYGLKSVISVFSYTAEGLSPSLWLARKLPHQDLLRTVYVKTEFVYLSDFSACAFITEAAHLSLFIVVTRSLVPHFHFSPIKNPPSIATGGLLKPLCVYYTYTVDPSETPKRYSRHSLMLSINICLVANFIFVVFPLFLRCIAVILVYLSLVNNFFSFLAKKLLCFNSNSL